MTNQGGSSGLGVIYSYDPFSSTYTKLKDFDYSNGNSPDGNLMQASDGKLYGMTSSGGSSDQGVIFSFEPASSTYTKLQDYTGSNGANPGTGSAFIEISQNIAPTVSLTIPHNIVKYTAPARIKLNAAAIDEDGTITKVQFFNGNTRIHTETESPYGFLWIDVPVGMYSFTAKAFDDSGNVTTSNSIKVSVVKENVPPVVSIVSPADDTTYTGPAPATIRLIANAKDPNERISKVEFYSGSTLIRTENYYPYTYTWTNVKPGTYTITAKAYDEKGLSTISDPVTVTVKAQTTVNITPNKDNTIYSTSPTSSNGMGNLLGMGRQGINTNYTILRSLLRFDLSSIPAGSRIDSAKLTLQLGEHRSGGASLHKLKAKWGEGTSGGPGSTTGSPQQGYPATKGDATWNHAFYPDIRWTTPGGDFEPAATASTVHLAGDPLVILNLKTDVQSWVNDSSANFGWILKGTDDSLSRTAKLIYSRHTSEEDYWPTLTVTYTPKENLPTGNLGNSVNVTDKPSSINTKTEVNGALSLRLSPVPARSTLQIYTKELQLNKASTISVISSSGVVMKTIQSNASNKVVQLDVSSLVSGVYTVKVISGNKLVYKQFVKL